MPSIGQKAQGFASTGDATLVLHRLAPHIKWSAGDGSVMTTESASHGSVVSGFLAKDLETWIDIEAPPERVWAVLIDFPAWQRWNAFIPSVEGVLSEGKTVRIKVVPPGLKPMLFQPEIYTVRPLREIRWGGSFLWFVYRGDHSFLLEPMPGGNTRFRQIERFRGPLVLLMGGMMKSTEAGYHQMNLALKREAESR